MGHAIDGKRIGTIGGDFSVIHDGLNGPTVGAAYARPKTDDLVIEHEPRFFTRQRHPNPLGNRIPAAPKRPKVAPPTQWCGEVVLCPCARGPILCVTAGNLLLRHIRRHTREPVGINRGPVGIREIAEEIRGVEAGHAIASEPATQIFTIDRFKVGDAGGAHAEPKFKSGSVVHDAIHLGKREVRDELPTRRHAGVVEELLRQRQRRQGSGPQFERIWSSARRTLFTMLFIRAASSGGAN